VETGAAVSRAAGAERRRTTKSTKDTKSRSAFVLLVFFVVDLP